MLGLLLIVAMPVRAEDGVPPPPEPLPSYEDIQTLIDGLQSRIEGLNAAADESDTAIDFLSHQVEDAISLLSSREAENSALRSRAAVLDNELDTLSSSREELNVEMARLTTEKDQLVLELQQRVEELASLLSLEQATVESLNEDLDLRTAELRTTIGEKEQAEQKLLGLEQDLAATTERLDATQRAIDAKQAEMDSQKLALASLQDRNDSQKLQLTALEAALAEEQDAAGKLDAALNEFRRDAAAQSKLAAAAKSEIAAQTAARQAADNEIALLNQQIGALREQLTQLASALETAEVANDQKEQQIADLGRRLNLALASKLQELARYRSEFFGRLREVLGERPDVRIVGDRFVFQSELLFASGSAALGAEGRAQLAQLASTLKQIAAEIPPAIDWVLRVDGHTDKQPIQRANYPSNWELSTARAISVVHFLIEHGITADRLMAAGFGEFQPLDPGDDEVAYRRNRRIELKLTQK